MASFEALTFFLDPIFLLRATVWVGLRWFLGPCSLLQGSCPLPLVLQTLLGPPLPALFHPLLSAHCFSYFCFVATYVASWTALTSSATFAFHLFLASWVMCYLASSFLFYAAILSNSTKSEACHLGGHDSNTVKITSSMAMNGSFVHCCARSFHALM